MVKASGSQTRVYAVDEMGRPLGVYVLDANASNGFRVEEEYIHLDGWRPVAVIRPDAATGMANPQVFPILTDHLGTPRKVLDGSTGQTRWAWDAKQPFGHEMPLETPTAGLPAFTLDLRFPGQRFDEETGLFHNGFRDYHPGLGRYVQSDPLGLEAGWNTFSYGQSSPQIFTDPYGLVVVYGGHNEKDKISLVSKIQSMRQSSPTFNEQLSFLENSKTLYNIFAEKPGSGSSFGRNKMNQLTVGIDLATLPYCFSAQTSLSNESAIAHEVSHAYDNAIYNQSGIFGKLFIGTYRNFLSEPRATKTEGIVMSEIGQKKSRGSSGWGSPTRDYICTNPYEIVRKTICQ